MLHIGTDEGNAPVTPIQQVLYRCPCPTLVIDKGRRVMIHFEVDKDKGEVCGLYFRYDGGVDFARHEDAVYVPLAQEAGGMLAGDVHFRDGGQQHVKAVLVGFVFSA